MRVQSIGNLVLNQNAAKLKAATKSLSNSATTNVVNTQNLKTVSANQILSQMPNVSFKAYEPDDLSAYHNYEGPTPPAIEQEKYERSQRIAEDIENGRYVSAIGGKIALAQICHNQGQERDAFLLEQSMKHLYREIPDELDKATAKILIGCYNPEMAEYINFD